MLIPHLLLLFLYNKNDIKFSAAADFPPTTSARDEKPKRGSINDNGWMESGQWIHRGALFHPPFHHQQHSTSPLLLLLLLLNCWRFVVVVVWNGDQRAMNLYPLAPVFPLPSLSLSLEFHFLITATIHNPLLNGKKKKKRANLWVINFFPKWICGFTLRRQPHKGSPFN
jgi:hypothetical protein